MGYPLNLVLKVSSLDCNTSVWNTVDKSNNLN